MSSRSRRIRRLGGLVLLLAWAPIATANAVTCAVWCELNGGVSGHHAAAVHGGHDHGGVQQAGNGNAISDPSCSSPDLLVVSAIAPEVPAAPSVTVTAGDPPVSELFSLASAFQAFDTPPPRV